MTGKKTCNFKLYFNLTRINIDIYVLLRKNNKASTDSAEGGKNDCNYTRLDVFRASLFVIFIFVC